MSSRKNLSEFIRNHPDLGTDELIQEASKKGLVITQNYIYNIRSKDRIAAGAAPKKKVSKKAKVEASVKVKEAPVKVKEAPVKKKVSKKAKVAAVRGPKPRKTQPPVELGIQAAPTSVKALVAQSVAMRPPVAIVFFDSDALVKGMREGFQSDI